MSGVAVFDDSSGISQSVPFVLAVIALVAALRVGWVAGQGVRVACSKSFTPAVCQINRMWFGLIPLDETVQVMGVTQLVLTTRYIPDSTVFVQAYSDSDPVGEAVQIGSSTAAQRLVPPVNAFLEQDDPGTITVNSLDRQRAALLVGGVMLPLLVLFGGMFVYAINREI